MKRMHSSPLNHFPDPQGNNFKVLVTIVQLCFAFSYIQFLRCKVDIEFNILIDKYDRGNKYNGRPQNQTDELIKN